MDYSLLESDLFCLGTNPSSNWPSESVPDAGVQALHLRQLPKVSTTSVRDGATHDLIRGFKRRNFWLMETQPGNVNWHAKNISLNKGEGRAMAWHAIAHG